MKHFYFNKKQNNYALAISFEIFYLTKSIKWIYLDINFLNFYITIII